MYVTISIRYREILAEYEDHDEFRIGFHFNEATELLRAEADVS